MAADAKGVLSLGIFDGDGTLRHDRWREFILITPLFLWASWQVSSATGVITKWFVEDMPLDGLPLGTSKRKESRLAFAQKSVAKDVGVRFGLLLGALWLLNLVSACLCSFKNFIAHQWIGN
jgi:hypothetical protein